MHKKYFWNSSDIFYEISNIINFSKKYLNKPESCLFQILYVKIISLLFERVFIR